MQGATARPDRRAPDRPSCLDPDRRPGAGKAKLAEFQPVQHVGDRALDRHAGDGGDLGGAVADQLDGDQRKVVECGFKCS